MQLVEAIYKIKGDPEEDPWNKKISGLRKEVKANAVFTLFSAD